MKYTTNLNLKKPEESEFYDVNDFNDNADAIDTALMARLNLSGGTMTGQIKMAQDVAISRTVNNASIHITGSQNGNEGACITLFGKSSTDYKGCFAINAADDAGNSKQLIGKPDGTLIWNGNRLLTKVDKSLVLLHANASDLVTSIPKNSDLNNYTTAGTYECVGADFAATYSNTPYTYGNFRLIVINNSGDKTGTQMIIAGNSNKMYIRGFYTSTGTTTFKNWEQIITSNTYGLVRAATDTDVLDGDNDEAAITPAVYHDVSDFRHKNTAYSVGDKVECMFNFELFLECTQAGTTGSGALDTRNVTHGQVITDGTVKWTVRTHIRSVNGTVADANGNVTVATALAAHPVGSIYISTDSTSPAILFGGTWQELEQGRVLLSQGTSYPAGSTGGEATHKLTINEIPAHNHSGSAASQSLTGTFGIRGRGVTPTGVFTATKEGVSARQDVTGQKITMNASHSHTLTINNNGGGAAHNNMQPYLSVYMWKRTA